MHTLKFIWNITVKWRYNLRDKECRFEQDLFLQGDEAMLVGKRDFCDYQSIKGAVDELERDPLEKPVTLYIISGVYEEAVRIYRSNLNSGHRVSGNDHEQTSQGAATPYTVPRRPEADA